ncbi:HPr kinase/phosphorylase [Sphingosinithalassobacter portus]|uniref:HPr kinase/phosphorylase n=1 Tax=Stakelama portus TaxID=2676234 RepID=UPI000D6E6CFA|nr:HPr kinase/phosphatase C-terminal domain-containing protein [Sphingosinithalassobacter portus]
MTELSTETLHASCVAIGGHAVLIEGPSGAGKSDLALRLIDRGAALVSDDYTTCVRREGRLFASPPDTIAGKIEVRGVGIVEISYETHVSVGLHIAIAAEPPRLPDGFGTRQIAGVAIPSLTLAALEASAPLKVEYALARAIAA